MKRLLIVVLLLLAGAAVRGVDRFAAQPTPLDVATITEFIHDKKDFGPRTVPLERERFLAALSQPGVQFLNGSPDAVYKNPAFPWEANLGSYTGAFATSRGQVFLWSIVRRRVIEVRDAQHRYAWYALPQDLVQPCPEPPATGAAGG